jgi:hypothetical protein
VLGERQIDWIIDFGPGQSISARIADRHSFVREFLYRDIEEFVDPTGRDGIFHLSEKSGLYGFGKNRNTDISAAEFFP